MSYLVLIFMSAIMDAVTVKVYVGKWLGKPPLRISTIAYWSIFIFDRAGCKRRAAFHDRCVTGESNGQPGVRAYSYHARIYLPI